MEDYNRLVEISNKIDKYDHTNDSDTTTELLCYKKLNTIENYITDYNNTITNKFISLNKSFENLKKSMDNLNSRTIKHLSSELEMANYIEKLLEKKIAIQKKERLFFNNKIKEKVNETFKNIMTSINQESEFRYNETKALKIYIDETLPIVNQNLKLIVEQRHNNDNKIKVEVQNKVEESIRIIKLLSKSREVNYNSNCDKLNLILYDISKGVANEREFRERNESGIKDSLARLN